MSFFRRSGTPRLYALPYGKSSRLKYYHFSEDFMLRLPAMKISSQAGSPVFLRANQADPIPHPHLKTTFEVNPLGIDVDAVTPYETI